MGTIAGAPDTGFKVAAPFGFGGAEGVEELRKRRACAHCSSWPKEKAVSRCSARDARRDGFR